MMHLSVRHSACSALVAFATLGHVPAWHLSARNAPAGSSVPASAHVHPATHARARITLLLAHLDADLGMPELTDTDTHLAFISPTAQGLAGSDRQASAIVQARHSARSSRTEGASLLPASTSGGFQAVLHRSTPICHFT